VSSGERPLYTRLIPVLPVADVLAEREFYERLGFSHFVDPDEQYPATAFAALRYGESIVFGVALSPEFDPASADSRLWWQLETVDAWPIHERAKQANLEIEQPPQIEPWGRRTLKLRSPNGYVVTFEEIEK
jgi:uncharacterized glyoxalase superfamily protein PhnB